MRMLRNSIIFLLIASGVSAHAAVIATAQISVDQVFITPATGTIEFLDPWSVQTLAEARNNLGELEAQFSFAGESVAGVQYANASGAADPMLRTAQSQSASNLSGVTANSSSAGRGALMTRFRILGGTGPVSTQVQANVQGSMILSTDAAGLLAESEMVFSLALDGRNVLFGQLSHSIGPDGSFSGNLNGVFSSNEMLEFNTDYFLFLEADSESRGMATPEPAPAVLILFGFAVLLCGVRATRKSGSVLMLFVLACVGSPLAHAKYKGGDPPKCKECEESCSLCSYVPGGSEISLSERNLRERIPITELRSASGPTLRFFLTYNSYNADDSRAAVDTVSGYGWTHSFNSFLFSQRGNMFRMDEDGRITKYTIGATGAFTPGPGYFETLVRNPDGSFTLADKHKTRYRFASIPGTPFIVDGPVFRLTTITDRNNNVVMVTYAGGNATRITDWYGRVLVLAWNAMNKLSSVTDQLGRTTIFSYDATGRQLLRIRDAAGKFTTFSYNNEYQMIGKTDRDGRTFSYLYANGSPYAIRDGSGQFVFRLTNPSNWATDANLLAADLLRIYLPGTTTRTDGRNLQWTYDYDKGGFITRIRAPDGAITTFAYDPVSLRVASKTDANGNTIQYAHDAMGNLIRKIDAAGNVTTYTYEPTYNHMTSMTDPNGRVTSWAYDGFGNRIREVDSIGGIREWTYDIQGNVVTEKNKRGFITSHQYDSSGNRLRRIDPLSNATAMTYDAVGNLLTLTDENSHTTTYAYDALNRLFRTTDAIGGITRFMYDGEGNRVEVIDPGGHSRKFTYDERKRLTKTVDALGGVETSGYDGNNNRTVVTNQNGNVTRFTYDLQNRLIRTTDALGHASTQAYDPVGNITAETDANNHGVTYVYDQLNRKIRRTDALGSLTRYDYDMIGLAGCPQCTGPSKGSSHVTKVIDGNGKVTYFKYDGLDRLIRRIQKEGDITDVVDASDAVIRYVYDAESNRISMTEPNGNTTTYQYDALNRTDRIVNAAADTTVLTYDPAGNLKTTTEPGGNVITSFYDAMNRLVREVDSVGLRMAYTYDADGNRLTETDANGNTTTYGYDGNHRVIAIKDALANTTQYTYDPVGNLLIITDRESRETAYVYDSLNRRVRIVNALGHTRQMQYDAVGNMIRLIDGKGSVTAFSYDNVNRLIRETYADPAPNVRQFTYDLVGNLLSRRDQKGQTTSYLYNDLYFLLKRTYPTSPSDNFTYDLSGRTLTAERGGWLVSMSYDGANRMLQSVQNGKTVSYAYNVPARIRTVTYPGGRVITERMDPRQRLGSVNDGGSAPIAQYFYDSADRLLRRTNRNGTAATYTYNPNNWVTSLEHTFGVNRVLGFGYAYDREGNSRHEEKRHVPGRSEAYGYDPTYRLIEYRVGTLAGTTVPLPTTQTQYNLDPAGNWNSRVKDGLPELRTHNAANEILTVNGAPLLHDPNGNLAEDPTTRLMYDEENRLTAVSRKSDNLVLGEYRYDAFNRRVEKKDFIGVPTRFFYDGWRAVEEQTLSGVTAATYVFGVYVDDTLMMERAGQTLYYHGNTIYSIHGLTNNAGKLVEGYTYDAYGFHTTYLPGVNGTVDFGGDDLVGVGANSFYDNPHLFTGQRFDKEVALHHFKRRAYSASFGRFLQRDPLGYLDLQHQSAYEFNLVGSLYEYAASQPTRFLDPYGERNCDSCTGPVRNCGWNIVKFYCEDELVIIRDWKGTITEDEVEGEVKDYTTNKGTVTAGYDLIGSGANVAREQGRERATITRRTKTWTTDNGWRQDYRWDRICYKKRREICECCITLSDGRQMLSGCIRSEDEVVASQTPGKPQRWEGQGATPPQGPPPKPKE